MASLLDAVLTYQGFAAPAINPSILPIPGATNVIAFASGMAMLLYGPGTTLVASVDGDPDVCAGPAPLKKNLGPQNC